MNNVWLVAARRLNDAPLTETHSPALSPMRIPTLRELDEHTHIEPHREPCQESNVGGSGGRTQQAPERRATHTQAARKGSLIDSQPLHHDSHVRCNLPFQARMFLGYELTRGRHTA